MRVCECVTENESQQIDTNASCAVNVDLLSYGRWQQIYICECDGCDKQNNQLSLLFVCVGNWIAYSIMAGISTDIIIH